jgi:hypothetical protein
MGSAAISGAPAVFACVQVCLTDCPLTRACSSSNYIIKINILRRHPGGRGGIRTHGTLAGTPVFKTGALNHSATLPSAQRQSFSRAKIKDGLAIKLSRAPLSYLAVGSFTGTCGEVLTIRGLPSGWVWLLRVSNTRKNFSASKALPPENGLLIGRGATRGHSINCARAWAADAPVPHRLAYATEGAKSPTASGCCLAFRHLTSN